MSIFVDGKDIEYTFRTSRGLVGAVAEVRISGSTLVLSSPSVYVGDGSFVPIGLRLILEIVRQIEALAKEEGFARLIVDGKRLSGATPGRPVSISRTIR